ncbi:MAG: TetM/TetW/TetO/TetS family tetracycline resistance ribosomal protection protein [Lachnospiraceae bacterium]|nr:TetM/TetW/TetO/TetS family tetracycline resistance ribosomal protection protein [Lachnospiraceae bacterium]MDD3617405.1 TetM/TetW/TetO/TetS family tetracycline resistance ribosomal protection protein [Lachnospiraceae bacterium]
MTEILKQKQIVFGILAHVDAGKTTLSESMLYQCGKIRKLGRVDNRDAFLDTFELERERGITIFSKQAQMNWDNLGITLLDTPGHVDFSAEMERTLQVLDYAVLLISGADGIQGHTQTLWRLLKRYNIPAFIFVNKMDQAGTDKKLRMQELKEKFSDSCICFSDSQNSEEFYEEIAMADEALLEQYLERGSISKGKIAELISKRQVFPCFFGSALKLEGIEEFLNGLRDYTSIPEYACEFGAKVYKISRDEQGNRLTHMKITGGELKVKDIAGEEKINQIRIYSGAKYETISEVSAGTVCAVTGLTQTYPGQGLGIEHSSDMPILEPVLSYEIQLPSDCQVQPMLRNLKQLEEEEPELHIVWNEALKEIHAQLMGEVQIEILKRLIWDRFHVNVEFGPGNIVYKETIAKPVEGVGHFEPLRHYAEVHLLLEPGDPGSGISAAANCSEDVLDRNWQRLILTHIEEKTHKGVLTGSDITDLKITLIGGRAHQKHTEGGDFRQAVYRAIRQGLKKAESILLEPYYEYTLEIPGNQVGRAMADIQKMQGTFSSPEIHEDLSVLKGKAPVVAMRDYQKEVTAYSGGQGRLNCRLSGYEPCHNAEEILQENGYDSERDLENPTGSVFCAHGAGFIVPWNLVEEYMHVDYCFEPSIMEGKEDENLFSGDLTGRTARKTDIPRSVTQNQGTGELLGDYKEQQQRAMAGEQELKEIFARTYGTNQDRTRPGYKKVTHYDSGAINSIPRKKKKGESYLLVDGYNIIFAWDSLKELARVNMDGARDKLMDLLSNYQGYKKCRLILVFDAYKVKGFTGEVIHYHNLDVVFTKEAETADAYIEKVAHEMGRDYDVTVATSDGLEQMIIRGAGCRLLSARDLEEELDHMQQELREQHLDKTHGTKNYLFEHMDESLLQQMEEIRLGKNEDNK